jgi:hypothetical protein
MVAAGMSRALFAFALAAGLLSGCFNPHYASPGFACSTDVTLGQDCPPGQVCSANVCVDKGTNVTGSDLASSTEDLASTDLAGPVSVDMAKPPQDLAPPADLAMCQPKGGSCPNKNDAICCSGYCIYSSSTCK